MRRRELLMAAAGVTLASRRAWSTDRPEGVRITRVVGFDLPSRRPRFIGKNARRDVHGIEATDRMVRLYTNAGVEGLGPCRAKEEQLRELLGRDPFDFYDRGDTRMTGPLGSGTTPLWDLVGKLLNQPVHRLLGGHGPKRVPVYDGSIYFSDLLPEFADRPLDVFKGEIDVGLARGHRTFKVKVGRGGKWMEREEGYRRDIEVLTTIRKHAGPDVRIAVDANDGLDLERTKRLIEELGEPDLLFVEEMFPYDRQQYLDLRAFLRERKSTTLIADGEGVGTLEEYKPWIEAKSVDIFQGDMQHYGFEGVLAESAMARPAGAVVAPHNWGSLTGFYMQLQVGRAITNFFAAEEDPLSSPLLITEGYKIKDGRAAVPDSPGCGLSINEDEFRANARVKCDIEV